MATFVEIQTDAFAKNIAAAKSKKLKYMDVRRPYRGIEIKEDTYGVIKVIKSNGDEIPLVDAGGPNGPSETNSSGSGTDSQDERSKYTSTYNYSNFIIQQVQDARQEKQQILETFGDSYIFFFGERPRILVVNGLLMNTADFNWRTEFWHNYEHTLRGTKLVEQNARIYLYWDDIIVEGYMLGANAREDASMPYHIPFSFQLFVTNHTYLSAVGDNDYPITHAVNLQPLLQAYDPKDGRRLLKSQDIEADKYKSNVEKVRRAFQSSPSARVAGDDGGGFLSTDVGQGLMTSKNLLANALIMGVNAQNLTFLSIVNRMFRNRKMRFPKGIAGSESYSGPPQNAGQPSPWGFGPRRKLPLRSKIRHNIDEYVNGGNVEAQIDSAAADRTVEAQASANGYALEKKALSDLEEAGIDPVQHPGGSRFEKGHSLGAVGGNMPTSSLLNAGFNFPPAASEAALLALGFSVSAGLAAAGQGQQ